MAAMFSMLWLCRPFHGLFDFWGIVPSTEVLGYFHIVRCADETICQ